MKLRTFLTSAVAAAAALAFTAPAALAQTAYKSEYRMSLVLGTAFPWGKGGELWANKVRERTNGRINIKLYPGVSLIQGDQTREFSALRQGVIDMAVGSTINWSPQVRQLNLFSLPFLMPDYAAIDALTTGDVGKQMFTILEKAGVVPLAWGLNGYRELSNSKHPIKSPADLKGLKIRVQDMKSQTDMMSYLGGIPVAMSYGDVYTSLQTGIIDGTENNETALTTGKHGEVCKVYSVDQHAMIPDVLIMSEKVWETISPEDQEIILEAAHDSTDAHKVMWDTAVEEAVKEAQETMGVEFVYDVDKEAFREATQPMIEAYEEQYPGVKTLLDTIDAARGEE